MFLPESTNIKIKFVQYQAYEDEDARVKIARNLIEARFDKSKVVMDYLKQRYPSSQKELCTFSSFQQQGITPHYRLLFDKVFSYSSIC